MNMISLLFIFYISFSVQAVSYGDILKNDPSTEWLGREYADTIYNTFTTQAPETPLVIDLSDLTIFSSQGTDWKLIDALKRFYIESTRPLDPKYQSSRMQPIIFAVKSILPPNLQKLVHQLEFGERIQISSGLPHTEFALKEWVDRQPDGSIYPHDLLTQSLLLSDGRILPAWVTVWNVTREIWEQAAVRNFTNVRRPFAPLTGEADLWNGTGRYIVLPAADQSLGKAKVKSGGSIQTLESKRRLKLVISKRGDEYSYLYHRIGVEILALVVGKMTGSSKLASFIGKLGAAGEFFKYPATAGSKAESSKRLGNDVKAAESGGRLYELAEGLSQPDPSLKSGAENYLVSNAKKYGTQYQIRDSRPAHYYGLQVDPKFWAPIMTVEELILRFYHATHYDKNIFDPIILGTTNEGERLQAGLAEYLKMGAPSEELNELLRLYMRGVRATPLESDIKQDFDLNIDHNHRVLRENGVDFNFDRFKRHINERMQKVLEFVDHQKSRKSKLSCEGLFRASN